jgi:hypothetical protein
MRRPYPTVAAWKQRGRIPAIYDLDLIAAARQRGATLTLEDLARARAPADGIPLRGADLVHPGELAPPGGPVAGER